MKSKARTHVEMIEVRVGKKHDVDLGEVANGQRGRGQAFGAECKSGQPDSDPWKKNWISENRYPEKIDLAILSGQPAIGQAETPRAAEIACWGTRMGPDIGPVAAISTELNIIAVRALPCLEDEDEFMLRPVEAPHPGIGLRSDAEIEHHEAVCPSCGEQLRHMPPVHAGLDEAAARTEARHEAQGRFEETRKGGWIHLSGRHLELTMMDPTKAGDMAVDRHVVG